MDRTENDAKAAQLQRGLINVYFDTTGICEVDGTAARLSYRGIPIENLAGQASFLDVFFLLFYGRFPSEHEREDAATQVAAGANLGRETVACIDSLSGAHPVSVLRSVVSVLGAKRPLPLRGASTAAIWKAALGVLGAAAAATRRLAQLRRKGSLPAWAPSAPISSSILQALLGRPLEPIEAELIEFAFVVHAEHSACASTFAARIAASTEAEFHAAITAALAVFAGPRHGGAVEDMATMLEEIGAPERASEWVAAQRACQRPIPGFGHRVYRNRDPRAELLEGAAERLVQAGRSDNLLRIAEAVAKAMLPYSKYGIHRNVDGATCVLFSMLGVPPDYFVLLFALARTAGWSAHISEQVGNNILIRPKLLYAPAREERGHGHA